MFTITKIITLKQEVFSIYTHKKTAYKLVYIYNYGSTENYLKLRLYTSAPTFLLAT